MAAMLEAAGASERTWVRPLAGSDREAIRRLISRLGERKTCLVLQVGRQTLARALAGLPVRHATAVLIEARLEAIRPERR
jgi:hypothetical protein